MNSLNDITTVIVRKFNALLCKNVFPKALVSERWVIHYVVSKTTDSFKKYIRRKKRRTVPLNEHGTEIETNHDSCHDVSLVMVPHILAVVLHTLNIYMNHTNLQ